jgi:hypothetical protein
MAWVRRNATCPICRAPIGAVEMAENIFFIVEQQRESEDDDDDEHDEEEGDYLEDQEWLEADEDLDWYGWEGADEGWDEYYEGWDWGDDEWEIDDGSEQSEGDDEGGQLIVEFFW